VCRLLYRLLTLTGLLAACTGQPATGTVELRFTDPAHPGNPADPKTDAVQLVFNDAGGNVVLGPLEFPAAETLMVENVPLTATEVVVDYLENGGLAIEESETPLSFSGARAQVSNPRAQAAPAPRSRWAASVDASGNARLTVQTQGQPGRDTGLSAPAPFKVKGVAYSPAPIGYSNKFGPAFGDLFFDTFSPKDFLDFEKVWQRDIEKIRRNFNTIRVYSMMAIQVDPATGKPPADPETAQEFQHKKFLDALWNNGNNPVFVIVGIPMPDRIFIKPAFDAPDPNGEKKFWDVNLTRIVGQLKDHPAVLGFTIFNELGAVDEWTAAATTTAQHYWSQVETYSQRVKQLAPDKLVGWAFFDAPSLVVQGKGKLESFAKSIDFYGVNAFQKDTIGPTLDNYRQGVLGSAARPVILTEYGLPPTYHADTSTFQPPGVAGTFPTKANIDSIADSPASINAAAQAVARVIPQALAHPINAGMTYFEWADEWWKGDPIAYNNLGQPAVTTEITRWNGGLPNPGFPNGYGDEEGFGLHSIRTNGRTPEQVYTVNPGTPAGNTSPDILTERSALFQAVVNAYGPLR
jgi:hypothetical protein